MEKHEIFDYNPGYTITQCHYTVPVNDEKTGKAIMLNPSEYVLVRKDELEELQKDYDWLHMEHLERME